MERRGFIGALVTGLAAAFIPATASAAEREQETIYVAKRIQLKGGRSVEDVPVSVRRNGLSLVAYPQQMPVFLLATSHSRIHARPYKLYTEGDEQLARSAENAHGYYTHMVVRFATHDGSRLPKCDLTLWANVMGVWY